MVATSVGVSRALPPPWMTSRSALGPTTATRRPTAAAAARRPRCGAARSTRPPPPGPARPPPASRPPAPRPVGAGRHRCARPGGPAAPACRQHDRSRSTSPSASAAARRAPSAAPGPGISRSSPARAGSTVVRTANQSEITTPSQPHSSRRMVVSSRSWAEQWVPCRRLYAAIVDHAPAARSACSKGSSDTSRRVRSSGSEEISKRSSSWSLATRCFGQAATPPPCRPAHVRRRQLRGELRVLRQALEVAPAEGGALEVDGRAEQHLGALGRRLLGQRRPHPLEERRRPTSLPAPRRTGTTPTAALRRSADPERRRGRRSPGTPAPPRRPGRSTSPPPRGAGPARRRPPRRRASRS